MPRQIRLNAIKGRTDGSTPSAGQIGEIISSKVAANGTALTSGTVADVTSIVLSKGNYLMSGHSVFTATSGTPVTTNETVFLGTASGNNTTGRDTALNTGRKAGGVNSSSDSSLEMPTHFLEVENDDTTYYLKSVASFTGGNVSSFGYLQALRVS